MNVHDSLYSYNLYLAGHAPALMETQIMNETYGDRCCGSCRESSTGKKKQLDGRVRRASQHRLASSPHPKHTCHMDCIEIWNCMMYRSGVLGRQLACSRADMWRLAQVTN